MGNRHPAGLPLLPDRHHTDRSRRQGLASSLTPHRDGIGDDQSLAIQLALEITERVLLQVKLLEVSEGGGVIEPPFRGSGKT